MSKLIGIDLGTTNSCVAVIENGQPIVIHNKEGTRTTPSVVAFNERGELIVGVLARRQAVMNPERTIYSVKRLIGRKFESEEIQKLKPTCAFTISAAKNGDAWVSMGDRAYSPQEISAHVLEHMKDVAEDYLGEKVTEAVVTVPAYFNDSQRQATKDAGKLAGLNVRRILNEPTAAALAYGVNRNQDQRLAIVDLGGGTFDVSLLELSSGAFEVLASSGDTFLGGDDFDRRLVDFLVEYVAREQDLNLAKDATALRRLKEAAEQGKCELSHAHETSISVPFLAQKDGVPVHLEFPALSRELFESMVQEELERLTSPCEKALADAGLTAEEIDTVLLVGGMTRMPAVQRKIEQIFGKKPRKDVNPDEVVAMGAAFQGSILAGELEQVVLLDVTPHALGIRVVGDKFSKVIDRNTRIPCRERKLYAPAEQNQDFVVLEVYQGESDKASKNKYLGRFTLGGLPKPERGEVHVEVSFTLDADGILNVSAVEPTSGTEATIRIQPSGGLSGRQMDQIIEDKKAGKQAT